MNLQEFLKEVGGEEGDIMMFETEEEAFAAVQNDGNALQYVTESKQTEAIILAAVQNNGNALRYVCKKIFITK